MTRASWLSVLVLVSIASTSARAQPADVGAEALFREGRKLMKDGRFAEACAKLEASERLEDSVGTLLNLADCREKNGQLASAWATFLKAASAARVHHDGREPLAKSRAAALEPRLSLLTISVPETARVDGLVIHRDDAIVDPALWNQGVPIDEGTYTISGEAPGHEPWSTKVVVHGEAQKASVEVPRFKQLRELARAVTAAAPADAQTEPEVDTETDVITPPARITLRRKLAIGSAALGVVAIAGGIRYGLVARDLDREANAICPDTVCADPRGLDLNRRARRDLLASKVLFAGGGAAVAAGVVLWIVGAPHHKTTLVPSVGSDHTGVAITGRF